MTWLRVVLEAMLYPIRALIFVLIWIYKLVLSPMLPRNCRFYPTCSTYMLIAIREWGVIRGVGLGLARICRCRPHGKCGEDFVPLNIKGELKWIY